MERYPSKIDSTFRFVLLAARRAEQLMRGARPKIEIPATKPTSIALREVTDDLIDWEYGPPPAPPEEEMGFEGEADESPLG